jgi:hypothetical protein
MGCSRSGAFTSRLPTASLLSGQGKQKVGNKGHGQLGSRNDGTCKHAEDDGSRSVAGEKRESNEANVSCQSLELYANKAVQRESWSCGRRSIDGEKMGRAAAQ